MARLALRLRITINGHVYEAMVEELPAEGQPVAAAPQASVAPPPPVPAQPAAAGEVRAPLPGVVTEVKCEPGQRVRAGQALLVLEAMKMDNEITAPGDGTVRELLVARGQQVAMGQVLAVMG